MVAESSARGPTPASVGTSIWPKPGPGLLGSVVGWGLTAIRAFAAVGESWTGSPFLHGGPNIFARFPSPLPPFFPLLLLTLPLSHETFRHVRPMAMFHREAGRTGSPRAVPLGGPLARSDLAGQGHPPAGRCNDGRSVGRPVFGIW